MTWIILAILACVIFTGIHFAWRGSSMSSDDLEWLASWVLQGESESVSLGLVLSVPWSRKSLNLRHCKRPGEQGIELLFPNEGWRTDYFDSVKAFCTRTQKKYALESTEEHGAPVEVIRVDLGSESYAVARWIKRLLDEVFEVPPDSRILVKLKAMPSSSRLGEITHEQSLEDLDSRPSPTEKRGDTRIPFAFESVVAPERDQVSWVALLVGLAFTREVQAFLQRLITVIWTDDIRLAAHWFVFTVGTWEIGRWLVASRKPDRWLSEIHIALRERGKIKTMKIAGIRLLGISIILAVGGAWADLYQLWLTMAGVFTLLGSGLLFSGFVGRRPEAELVVLPRYPIPIERPILFLRDLSIPLTVILGMWVFSWRHLWLW